jgi:hypothetical protein
MGKKVKMGGGFSGHGFKFDSSETQLKDEQKKMQKVVMGLGDSDEDEESQDVSRKRESFFRTIHGFPHSSRSNNKLIRCSRARNQSKPKVTHLFYQPEGPVKQKIQLLLRIVTMPPRNWPWLRKLLHGKSFSLCDERLDDIDLVLV